MYVEILDGTIKNFLSYGNSETYFKYENGLGLVTAKNGSGKSAMFLDALYFNAYGVPYRSVKISELVNRKNSKNLYTSFRYRIDGKDIYRIVRTYAPQKLEIYKNDDKNPMESASSKKIDQEFINSILGIDKDLFKLIIAIATSYNKPFLDLSLPEKRKVAENLFSINIFGEMLTKARKKVSSIKTEKTIFQNNIKQLESILTTLKKQITEIESSMKDFDQKKEDEISNLIISKNNIEKQISEIVILKQKLEIGLTNIILDEIDYVSEQIKLDSEIKTSESKIKETKTQIKFLEKNTICPLCSNDLTPEHKEKELNKLNDVINKNQKKIDSSKKKLDEVLKKIVKQKEIKKSFDESKTNISMIVVKLQNLEKNIQDLNKQISIVKNRILNIDISSIKNEYEGKINIYKEESKTYNKLTKELNQYEIVSKMLSEEGIKSYFFKRLVPILNTKINEYLNIFDLPVSINFDETMQEKIDMIASSEKDLSYKSFSEGEKKRIDIAILLSFISTMKTISNWNCNLLIFDEILDSATDSEGLEKLLTSIKEITRNDLNLCAYVISHRDAFQDIYTHIIKIKKVSGFSKIEVIQN